jgi:ABC-type transporter Mla subunit MlaD
MRRLLAIVVLAVIAAGAGYGVWRAHSSGSAAAARFDVIFDDARGLVSGQLVKVAGATAGSITNVTVTSDFKARIEATIERRFVPLHQDATCTIRPEGLIAENYLECDPGSRHSPVLPGRGGHPPTIPVAHTTEPVSLLDLFNTFNLPTQQRVQVLLSELGIATAARGEDINQILLRANPTLALARRVIGILQSQRSALSSILDSTNTLVAQIAGHVPALKGFINRSAALTTLLASHRGPLAAAIGRLPSLLQALHPALQQVDAVARNGTPLLDELHAAAPSLDLVEKNLGPLAQAAGPVLPKIARAIKQAIPAIRTATPLVDAITAYAQRSLGSTELTSQLYKNLERHGFSEYFLSVIYYVATSLSRFDSTSHVLPLMLTAPHGGKCGKYSTKPVAGCGAHYGSRPAYHPEKPQGLQALVGYLLR